MVPIYIYIIYVSRALFMKSCMNPTYIWPLYINVYIFNTCPRPNIWQRCPILFRVLQNHVLYLFYYVHNVNNINKRDNNDA